MDPLDPWHAADGGMPLSIPSLRQISRPCGRKAVVPGPGHSLSSQFHVILNQYHLACMGPSLLTESLADLC